MPLQLPPDFFCLKLCMAFALCFVVFVMKCTYWVCLQSHGQGASAPWAGRIRPGPPQPTRPGPALPGWRRVRPQHDDTNDAFYHPPFRAVHRSAACPDSSRVAKGAPRTPSQHPQSTRPRRRAGEPARNRTARPGPAQGGPGGPRMARRLAIVGGEPGERVLATPTGSLSP